MRGHAGLQKTEYQEINAGDNKMITKIRGGFVRARQRYCGICKKPIQERQFYFFFFNHPHNDTQGIEFPSVHKDCLFKELDITKEYWKDEKKGYEKWLKRKILKSLK